jgi:hypothetical protein
MRPKEKRVIAGITRFITLRKCAQSVRSAFEHSANSYQNTCANEAGDQIAEPSG